jgi:hypothetical protein
MYILYCICMYSTVLNCTIKGGAINHRLKFLGSCRHLWKGSGVGGISTLLSYCIDGGPSISKNIWVKVGGGLVALNTLTDQP